MPSAARLRYRQTLYYAPAHAIALDILSQVTDFLARPYLAEGNVVQCRDDALNTNLSQLCKRYLVFLAKPSPCSFHSNIIFNE